MNKTTIYTILASVFASATLMAIGVLLGARLSAGSAAIETANLSSESPNSVLEEQSAAGENETIAIPGYEKLVMKAGELRQTVNFENPATNDCYIRISIILADGTEVYGSGLIKPGQTVETIEILSALEAGIYRDTTLQYECYSIGDLSPLNGAKSMLDLEVVP